MAGPIIPTAFVSIDWTQRAQVLNQIGTLINNYITYWVASATPVTVPATTSGNKFLDPTVTLANFIVTLNAVNTQFTLGVTPLSVPTHVDKNNFQATVNSILTYLTALHTAKP